MKRNKMDLWIMMVLFFCLAYAALTGILMHAMHVPLIIFHDQAGYGALIMSIVHIVRRRDQLKAYFR